MALVILGLVIAPVFEVVGRDPALTSMVIQVGPQPPMVVVPGTVSDYAPPRFAEHVVGVSV